MRILRVSRLKPSLNGVSSVRERGQQAIQLLLEGDRVSLRLDRARHQKQSKERLRSRRFWIPCIKDVLFAASLQVPISNHDLNAGSALMLRVVDEWGNQSILCGQQALPISPCGANTATQTQSTTAAQVPPGKVLTTSPPTNKEPDRMSQSGGHTFRPASLQV